jgi:hypothetical protein
MDLDLEIELAAAAARARRQADGRVSGPMRGVALANEGIANFGDSVAGLPNRGVNAALGALGIDYRLSETPFRDAMGAGGVMMAEPENLGERAVVGAGEAALAMLPATAALRGLSGASGLTGQVARSANQAYVAAPRSAISAELAAGAAAPVAGELAARATGSEAARGFGAVAGGMAAGIGVANIPNALAAAGRGIMATPVGGAVIRGTTSAIAPFTRTGARIIAQDTVRGVTADRFAAADALAGENIGNLTPAQHTGDRGIMGIERALAAADPQVGARVAQRGVASQAALRAEARAPAQGREIADTRAFFRDRMDHHRAALARHVRTAERRVDAALRNVRPGASREDASETVVAILDREFRRVSDREAQLWARVPKDEPIPTTQAKQAYREMVEEATRVAPETVPGKAHQFLGDGPQAFGDDAPMPELYKLYSRLRRAGREAMAQPVPDEETARRSGKIADAILRDIEAAEGFTQSARVLAEARAYSTQLNEAFGQGAVARMLARTRAGDDRMDPATALRGTVGRGREAGGAAVDDVRRAAGSQADPRMQDFMRDEFLSGTVGPDGRPSVRQIDSFTERNREALGRFADGVGSEVGAVRRAAAEAARRADRRDAIVAQLDQTTRGTVAGLVNVPNGRAIARGIFEADNPAAAAGATARAAQRDATGDAYLGLKGALADEVISRSLSGEGLSGRKMMAALDDPTMRRVLSAALPPAELSRLRTIAAQLRKLETAATAPAVDTENLPNMLISTFVQIQAAKAGRAMGTGTIQVPGIIVNRARNWMARIATDHADALIRAAMEDPRLLSDLLIGSSAGAARTRQAEQRFTQWAVGVLAASGEDQPQE